MTDHKQEEVAGRPVDYREPVSIERPSADFEIVCFTSEQPANPSMYTREAFADLQRRLDNAEACAAQRAKVMDLRADRIRELEADLAASQRAVIETGKALRFAEEDRSRLQAKCGDLLERARAAEDSLRGRMDADTDFLSHLIKTNADVFAGIEKERDDALASLATLRTAFDDCNRMAAETERKLDAALIRAEAAEAELARCQDADVVHLIISD